MPAHPFQRCHPCARPHSAHFAPPATPLTNPQAPMKRKTDDCTSLRSSASLISSAPHRHQTCRAEYFTSAHFPDKSAQSAASSRHLRNIIQPLLCDCPSGLPDGRGSAHTAHNPDYVKYLPPPPSRKWTRTEPLYLMAFSQSHKCLRPTPPTTPDHWSAPAPPLAAPEPSASAVSLPKLPVLRPRRFGAAPYQGQCTRNPPRTGTSPSRRGERYHHTHLRLHPASRAQTLIRPSGVMRVPSSAPHPAAAPLHPPHPSPSTRPPSSGSRASLFVFRDPVLMHLRHSTLPGSSAATVPERGRCALRPHPPRCGAGRLRPAPQLPGPRDSVRLRRPQTLRPKRKTAAARSRKSTDFLVNRSRPRSSAPASSLRSLAGINHFDSAITIAGIWEDISSMALLSSL